jgi:hypothetical protein
VVQHIIAKTPYYRPLHEIVQFTEKETKALIPEAMLSEHVPLIDAKSAFLRLEDRIDAKIMLLPR